VSLMPYFDRDGITVYCGDVREVLSQLDLSEVSCVVADPPGRRGEVVEGASDSPAGGGHCLGERSMSLVNIKGRASDIASARAAVKSRAVELGLSVGNEVYARAPDGAVEWSALLVAPSGAAEVTQEAGS